MKIYTKTGDKGMSSLWGGQRVSKASARINAYGSVDELNSLIGFILSLKPTAEVSEILNTVQSELMVVGSDLATPEGIRGNFKQLRIETKSVESLEKSIDKFDKGLEKLTSFILPSGSQVGSALHLARAVCRRAERDVVALASIEPVNSVVQIYLNRLSDFLFTAARKQNQADQITETSWKSS